MRAPHCRRRRRLCRHVVLVAGGLLCLFTFCCQFCYGEAAGADAAAPMLQARRAMRKIKKSAEAVHVSDLGESLVSTLSKTAHKPPEEILPPGGTQSLVTEMAVHEGILVTTTTTDVARLFAAALIRRLVELTGYWRLEEIPGTDRVLIIRSPPGEAAGKHTVCVSATGFDASEEPAPIIFTSGMEYMQVLFMVMASMKQTTSATGVKELTAFIPVLKAWPLVAKSMMLYYTFLTVPLEQMIHVFEHSIIPTLEGDMAETAAKKLGEFKKLLEQAREIGGTEVKGKHLTIQLDPAEDVENVILHEGPKHGLPLLQYSKSSEFLKKALRGRETFLHALESESEESDDMVMELVQQAVQNYFETHHEDLEIAELTRVEFWADDEKASAMLDQILQATNAAVRQAFEHVREQLRDHVQPQAFISEEASEFETAEKAVKGLGGGFVAHIKHASAEMEKYFHQDDPEAFCRVIQKHDVQTHSWLSYIVYMYHEFSSLCKKNLAFCEKLAECLRSSTPDAHAAVETYEVLQLLNSIVGAAKHIPAESYKQSMTSELQADTKTLSSIERAMAAPEEGHDQEGHRSHEVHEHAADDEVDESPRHAHHEVAVHAASDDEESEGSSDEGEHETEAQGSEKRTEDHGEEHKAEAHRKGHMAHTHAAADSEEEGEATATSESHTGKSKKKRKRNKKKKKGHAYAAAESTMKDEEPSELTEPPVDDHTGLTNLGVSELLVEGKAAMRKTLAASHHKEPEPHAKARGFLSDKGNFRSSLALIAYGLVRAALQAVRYYTAYRRLDMPAIAKLASDCYLMPEQKAVTDEIAAGEHHMGDAASGTESVTKKSHKSHKHHHHSFLQLFSALGIRRLKRWRANRRRKRKHRKEPKPRASHAEPVSLHEAFKSYRAAACLAAAIDAGHAVIHQPWPKLSSAEEAKDVLVGSFNRLQSSWKNELFTSNGGARVRASFLHTNDAAILSPETFRENRTKVLTWLDSEIKFLFGHCSDASKTLHPFDRSAVSVRVKTFGFSDNEVSSLESIYTEICEGIQQSCSHCSMKKGLTYMAVPETLVGECSKIPRDPSQVKAHAKELGPEVARLLHLIANNDYGRTFDRVLRIRKSELKNASKYLYISLPATHIKKSLDFVGLSMVYSTLQNAHHVDGRLNVLQCLREHHVLASLCYARTASSRKEEVAPFPLCHKPTGVLEKKAHLEEIYHECSKEDTSAGVKPSRRSRKKREKKHGKKEKSVHGHKGEGHTNHGEGEKHVTGGASQHHGHAHEAGHPGGHTREDLAESRRKRKEEKKRKKEEKMLAKLERLAAHKAAEGRPSRKERRKERHKKKTENHHAPSFIELSSVVTQGDVNFHTALKQLMPVSNAATSINSQRRWGSGAVELFSNFHPGGESSKVLKRAVTRTPCRLFCLASQLVFSPEFRSPTMREGRKHYCPPRQASTEEVNNDTLPTYCSPLFEHFDASDWTYLAEGGVHVVFRYTGSVAGLQGKVLKIRRDRHHPMSWRLLLHFTAHINELCGETGESHDVERASGRGHGQPTPVRNGVYYRRNVCPCKKEAGRGGPYRKEGMECGEVDEESEESREKKELPLSECEREVRGADKKPHDTCQEAATYISPVAPDQGHSPFKTTSRCACPYCFDCLPFFSPFPSPSPTHRLLYGLISPLYLSPQNVALLPVGVVSELLNLSRRKSKKNRSQSVCRENSSLASSPAGDLPRDQDTRQKKGGNHPPRHHGHSIEGGNSCMYSDSSSLHPSEDVHERQRRDQMSPGGTGACIHEDVLFPLSGNLEMLEGTVPCILEDNFLSVPPDLSAVVSEHDEETARCLPVAKRRSQELSFPTGTGHHPRVTTCQVDRHSDNITNSREGGCFRIAPHLRTCHYYSVELKPKCGLLEDDQSTDDDNESECGFSRAESRESGRLAEVSAKLTQDGCKLEHALTRCLSPRVAITEESTSTVRTIKPGKAETDREAMESPLTEHSSVCEGDAFFWNPGGEFDSTPSSDRRKKEKQDTRVTFLSTASAHSSLKEGPHQRATRGGSLPSRFTMQQFVKLSTGKVASLSLYDPTQFFQCTYPTLSFQLKHLMQNPQNNLSVFLNGSALSCESLTRPVCGDAASHKATWTNSLAEGDFTEFKDSPVLVDILARVWEASRDLFEGILLLQAFAASQQRLAVRLARELRRVSGPQHEALRQKHLAELEAYSEAVNEGLRGAFHPRGEASTDDPTSGNSACSPGISPEVMTTCSRQPEHRAVGLKDSTVEDVARALQEHHDNLGRRLALQLRSLANEGACSHSLEQTEDNVKNVTKAAFAWVCRYLLGRAFMDVSIMTNLLMVDEDEVKAYLESFHPAPSLKRFRRLPREYRCSGNQAEMQKRGEETRVEAATSGETGQQFSAPSFKGEVFYRLSLVDIDFKSDARIE
ncbi:inositol-pentakisphosphate 2-kinase, partial [Cystoisospora suis]